MRFGLPATLIGALTLIAWDEIRTKQRVPHPESFMHAILVWAILGVIGELGARDIATLFAVGLLISMIYVYYLNKQATAPADTSSSGTSGSNGNVTDSGKPII